MKIADGRQTNGVNEKDSGAAFLELTRSGELARAGELGQQFAEVAIRELRAPSLPQGDETPPERLQRLLLYAFAVDCTAEYGGLHPLLEAALVNAFYPPLESLFPGLYVEKNSAFSFYYLVFRRGGEVDKGIGRVYAMLCGRAHDEVLRERGEALYCHYRAIAEEAIKEALFPR